MLATSMGGDHTSSAGPAPPTGAGKTTLMDVLAGRKTGGTISGEMHIKGFPKEQRTFARVTGYVEQVG